MKNKEVQAFQTPDLQGKIIELEELLLKLRFTHSIKPLDNPKRMLLIKRDIARMKTELRMRDIQKNEQ